MTDKEKRKTINISKEAHDEARRIAFENEVTISEVAEWLLLGHTEKEIKKLAKEKKESD
ncbi:MAG TPA: hypothetical protein PKV80_25370 [Leptospiraceae bacterium]|nr:hypothetical protein [Leptospiraceae bacterium]HNF27823.1 hypothetical protein [Leptospiraceae bacterium]